MSSFRAAFLLVVALLLVSSFASAQCAPASNPGAKICSPVNGSTVTSQVHVVVGTADTAHRVTEINVYVDNVSVFKTTTASSVDTNVTIKPGAHTLRIQVWDTTGTIYRDSVSFTVSDSAPPPPTCTPATDPGAKICVPANGSTVSSPFNVQVVTKDTTTHRISAIYTYLDNVVVNKTAANSANFQTTASTGTHNLRVQAWDT